MVLAIEQKTVGVREAAALTGASVKRVRAAIRRGEIRAELRPGKFGAEWRIEQGSLPEAFTSPAGIGQALGGGAGVEQAVEVLRAELREERERRGEALLEVGRLQGTLGEQRRLLEARAASLQGEAEEARAEATEASRTIEGLRQRLRSRTWVVGLLLVGFLVALATVLVGK